MHDRYHGHETANHYQQQLETRVRRPGETIADFAYDLRKILSRAYDHLNDERLRYPLLKRAFLRGLSNKLRKALSNFEFNNFEQLIMKAITIDGQQEADRALQSETQLSFVKAVEETDPNSFLLNKMQELTMSIAAINAKISNKAPQNKNSNKKPFNTAKNSYANNRQRYVCGYCGKVGHSTERCFLFHPELKRNNDNNSRNQQKPACNFCQSTDHVGRNCPFNPTNQQSGFVSNQGN